MHKSQEVLKEWEGRELRAQFDRFDSAATSEDDPRLDAARGVARQVQALTASDEATDTMVDRLMARLTRLLADRGAAASAVEALRAAGAGSTGTERLAAAAGRLDDESTRVLDGMSELYATLLDVEQGRSGDASSLGDMLAWLQAEAEIARSVRGEEEAMRPASPARRRGTTTG